MSGPFGLPLFVLTDSYKLAHPFLYPDASKMVAYGSFRRSYEKSEDQRILFYGMRYMIETYFNRQWTEQDVFESEAFFSTHLDGFLPFPFPKELFLKFIRENNGYFPIKLQALPEGSVIYPHTPVFQLTAQTPYANLVTFLESLLNTIWYPTTVATLSRRCRDIIEAAFEKSTDPEFFDTITNKLRDFGFRGCTSVEQAILGGSAHLVNFTGSSTLSAAFYAQYRWNKGRPLATCIPGTEHSVMTSHASEKEAILKLISTFGAGVFACVMDSYDYAHALEKLLPQVASHKLEKGGVMVLRPDSGDPIETVLMALRAAEKVFGVDINSKGYKVLRGCSVVQGDGIGYDSIYLILDAVLEEGFSAQSITFGMGGGLLQKVDRDTMSFATKLSYREDLEGLPHYIAKLPKTDPSKASLPGYFRICSDASGLPTIYPKIDDTEMPEDILKTVYDHGPVLYIFDDFDTIRKRASEQWSSRPLKHNPISPELKKLMERVRLEREQLLPSPPPSL